LCRRFGADLERGELLLPDRALVGGMVRNICFANARTFFGLELDHVFAKA
jgi:glucuronate isomerase